MRFVTGLFAALLAGGFAAVEIAHAETAAKCVKDDEFKPIRGFCSNQYLRFDVLNEVGRTAKKLAYEKHFTLVLDWGGDALFRLAAQIRHNETPLRSRKWRGEFLILIRKDRRAFSAESIRAKSPLWPQVHRNLHQRYYAKIADAFARSMLGADDPAWAAEVRRLLPSAEEVAAMVEVERLVTDDQACPVLAQRIQEAARLTPEPIIEAEEKKTLSIQIHPEVYDVVLANYPRRLYTTDTEPERAVFRWAEGTVEALEPCWRRAAK